MYRVALISTEYPPHVYGGLGVHVDQITRAMGGRVNWDIFTPQRGNYRQDNPSIGIIEATIPKVNTSLEFAFQFCQSAAAAAEQCGASFDLLHCHDWMTVLCGLRIRETLKKPLVFNLHLPQSGGTFRVIDNLGLVGADLVIVNSQAVYNEIMERGLPIRLITVIPNGVDTKIFCPAPDWPADDGYILFVGRLVPQKGVDVLLRAFRVILQKSPDVNLIIVGDGELELALKRLARFLGVSHRVSFVKWQTGEALVRLYQRARVVVIPSIYEPFGIVALEAMACERPVIASRLGGLREILEDGIQGYMVAPEDHLELARRINLFICNPASSYRMGKEARTRALQFSWNAAGEQTIAAYQNLIGKCLEPNQGQMIRNLKEGLRVKLKDNLRPALDPLLDPNQPLPVGLAQGIINH